MAELAKVLSALEGIKQDFNESASGGEQVSLADSRLKRTAAEEQNHREKIASLRQQLAQLRDGITLAPSLS